MRKVSIIVFCLIVLLLAACETVPSVKIDGNGKWGDVQTASASESAQAVVETPPSAGSTDASATVSAVSTDASMTPASASTPHTTPSPSPATSEGPKMYSSYAHMVSFDPARGTADFDYFDLLRGNDAAEWLVSHEGYSEADAEAAVAEFADSEFIEKNVNPQLRTVDLTDVPVTLMFDPATGDMFRPDSPLVGSLTDLYNLYELDPDLVLNSFFYWIEVSDGKAVSVEQVFWP